MGTGLRTALLGGALWATGCGPEPVTVPEPPDAAGTAALVAVYDMPTAILDARDIVDVFADARMRLQDLNLDWFPGLVLDPVIRIRRRLADAGLPDDPAKTEDTSRPVIRAVANVQRICAGWDDPPGPPDQSANGVIDLTAIVETGRLNPQLWGTATACRTRASVSGAVAAMGGLTPTAVNATVDGTLILYALGPLPEDLIDAQFLVRFEGSIGVGGQVASVAFDFEYLDGSVKFRVPVASGGDAIVTVGPTLSIQGANATFSCDLAPGGGCQSSG
jgi:hypothetical protein